MYRSLIAMPMLAAALAGAAACQPAPVIAKATPPSPSTVLPTAPAPSTTMPAAGSARNAPAPAAVTTAPQALAPPPTPTPARPTTAAPAAAPAPTPAGSPSASPTAPRPTSTFTGYPCTPGEVNRAGDVTFTCRPNGEGWIDSRNPYGTRPPTPTPNNGQEG